LTYRSGSARVSLDTATVLAVDNLRILESDSSNGVIALSANGTNGKTMATGAIEITHDNVATTGDSNAVVLVVDLDVLQCHSVTAGDVESVGVVSSWVTTTEAVGLVTSRVIESESGDGQALDSADIEAVSGPVLDVEIGNLSVV
jgi:hypothetical protein